MDYVSAQLYASLKAERKIPNWHNAALVRSGICRLCESTQKLSSSLVLTEGFELWKQRGQMRCVLASDCRNTAVVPVLSGRRGWCEGQIALFND